jgi:hypothetical protein
MRNFKRRVLASTGMPYHTIPRGVEGDLLGGQIVAKRNNTYVVTSGYPEMINGTEVFTRFLRVKL